MTVVFHDAAREELDEAVAHYDRERDGLGDEFNQEVQRAIQRIVDFPEAWTKVRREVRCCQTDRFPYGIIYVLRAWGVLTVAVAHLHRRKGYWKNRLR